MDLHEPLAALFRLSPNVQWVLTSRRPLGIHAEQLVPVGSLTIEDGVALLTHRVQALGVPFPGRAELGDSHRCLGWFAVGDSSGGRSLGGGLMGRPGRISARLVGGPDGRRILYGYLGMVLESIG